MANRIERFLENEEEEGIDIGNVVTKRNASFLPFISTSFLKLSLGHLPRYWHYSDSMILASRRGERVYIYLYIYMYIVESLA